ncbi:hypothetical protein KQX54_007904 [Cotesia glomerata]|uniref:Uncharacterized protein n=1 Tax=Cotesia glomerata TaxID=32391 RepID=A0AAV7J4Z9_COTGL|nr:hypothetical protein KQX54_007904 [Cotesia glomerata]
MLGIISFIFEGPEYRYRRPQKCIKILRAREDRLRCLVGLAAATAPCTHYANFNFNLDPVDTSPELPESKRRYSEKVYLSWAKGEVGKSIYAFMHSYFWGDGGLFSSGLERGMQMPIRREEVVIASGKWKRNRKTQPWFIRKLREEG